MRMLPVLVGGVALAIAPVLSSYWIGEAKEELVVAMATAPEVTLASPLDYCSPALKRVLRRVLLSCGLIEGGTARGCQPVDVGEVAGLAGEDFNALFLPLSEQAGIVQFDKGSAEVDDSDKALLNQIYTAREGAPWMLVVSRASPEGSPEVNRALSKDRAQAVLDTLKATDPEAPLDGSVGLLWLGEELGQLEGDFCTWRRSGDADGCSPDALNRSAFVSWIDCTI